MSDPDAKTMTSLEDAEGVEKGVPAPIVPDHTLLRQIGSGSYGEVWLAQNIMGTYRAVKVVYRSRFGNERPYDREFAGIEKFEPVSRSHEGLVDVLQIGRDDRAGYFYYVMELADDATAEQAPEGDVVQASSLNRPAGAAGRPAGCLPHPDSAAESAPKRPGSDSPLEGASGQTPSAGPRVANRPSAIQNPATYVPKTLSKVLSKRGRLPVAEGVPLAMSLTAALGHLHQHGLIHRDIKPSNIIFVNGVPKLADIGLVASMTEARTFVGTEGYIPPEGPGTPQADLYSLGKVFYEMNTGKDRQSFPELPTELARLPERKPLLAFNDVVVRACHNELSRRYPAAEEMLSDLALLQDGKAIRGAGGRRLGAWLRARPVGVGAVLVSLGLAAGLLVWLGPFNHPKTGTDIAGAAGQLLPATTARLKKVAGLPAEEVLKLVYTLAPPLPAASSARPQLQFKIQARHRGEAGFRDLSDGQSLRSEVDGYQLVARPLTPGYLYIFQVDSLGQQDWLFPRNPGSAWSSGFNPVAAGQPVRVPAEEAGTLFLNTTLGVEHIYVVFSATRWPELEQLLAATSPGQAPAAPLKLAQRVEAWNELGTRGVGGIRLETGGSPTAPAGQSTLDGQTNVYQASNQIVEASGSFLVLERWFNHGN